MKIWSEMERMKHARFLDEHQLLGSECHETKIETWEETRKNE